MKGDKKVEMVNSYGLMGLVMKDNSRRIMYMVMDSIYGVMVGCIEAGGKIARWILQIKMIVSLHGLMAGSISYINIYYLIII